ncbi:amidophosphoribosyltransferase [Acetobacter peroxydans]|jgi:amidophosphoribosyltransferase|uniref:Amidophosphoribosyltransferase n=1 Tax=Acetobacter peroxydans TaxID=104098 RepID=A0A4Y3TUE8_9PROT|nr:amidophosphoribosyltransferase [Acetobacter peroxydans]MCI2007634.1 amidophosphoribosyltransferase [Acetobacter peroxydans]MCI2079277.1 amidophosphoribosyltransferase [Acetobacter peroxydans]NHO16621.1 amidophosphoribosyltransferase [Acetobacter peroxydans]GBR37221.1 amidophosphoribosyltransferase [Acetobacter peroxydans NBRC 13755]GBR39013.1 amidophosphoribosyltransferase [Acetobacter peroxydans]
MPVRSSLPDSSCAILPEPGSARPVLPTDPSTSACGLEDDHLHEECAVFGIWNARDAAPLTTLGLHALQHRGQEAAGIVSFDPTTERFHSHRGLGLVGDVFADSRVLATLEGSRAIGHNRYATSGATLLRNVQPLFAEFAFGGLAVAHNGNLTNANMLRRELIRRGCLFQSTTDSEVFVHLIAISLYATVEDRLIDALKRVEGAYSLVVLSQDALIGVRDPMGVRPLVLGRMPKDSGDANAGAWVLASETCGLDIIGAEFVRDVEPGELVIIDDSGVRSLRPFGQTQPHFCVFEYIYFARPDSVLEGLPVYGVRKQIGRELAHESSVEADVVVPVPDSGVPSAIGYAEASGIPFELGIIRNHYVGRTFIEPTDQVRHLGVKMKHSPNRQMLDGKRVVLVDDSIVRGTTSRKIVDMVRAAGASEVHMRISSPPTKHSCFYGIDTPERSKLLAAQHDLKTMAELIGVDSLAFISLDGLYRAMGHESRTTSPGRYCDACFTGDYPIPLTDNDAENGPGSA